MCIRDRVISGHRRLHAAVKAGITEVPALIYALDRDSAAIAVVDSNLHREHILPSERAFAYRMKLEAMSRQGHRSDLTSDQLGRKLETAEIIAQQSDDSKSQVRRYIRLTLSLIHIYSALGNICRRSHTCGDNARSASPQKSRSE